MRFTTLAPTAALLCVVLAAPPAKAETQPNDVYTLVDPAPGSIVADSSTYAADALFTNLAWRLDRASLVLASSFVNLANLDETSGFGRLVSNQIGSRLAQYGFSIVETRLRTDLAMRQRQGEFLLTRDAAKAAARQFGATAALVGTYAPAGKRLHVSARIVRLEDSAVLAAYDYSLPLKGEVRSLMGATGEPNAVLNRFGTREPAFAGAARTGRNTTPPREFRPFPNR